MNLIIRTFVSFNLLFQISWNMQISNLGNLTFFHNSLSEVSEGRIPPPSLPQDLRRLFPDERDMVQITLVEAKDILSSFDHRLRAYTERLIRRRKSMQILKASVTGTSPFLFCSFNFPFHSHPSGSPPHTHTSTHNNSIEMTSTSVKLNDGTVLSCGMVVWSTGLAPRYSWDNGAVVC